MKKRPGSNEYIHGSQSFYITSLPFLPKRSAFIENIEPETVYFFKAASCCRMSSICFC